jgi:hypothetical protein
VTFTDEETACTCGDFARQSKKDPNARCKHILAVLNCIPAGDVQGAQFLEKSRPQLDERFIIQIEGQDFVKFQGLLDLGHQKGISQIEVEPIQLPTSDNGHFAVCKATIIGKAGETFTDIGDSSPQNTNSRVSKHLLRMASTRAIARALRAYTNVGLTALEELADLDDAVGSGKKKPPVKPQKKAPAKPKAPAASKKGKGKSDNSDNSQPKAAKSPDPTKEPNRDRSGDTQPKMSEAQKRAIYNLSRRRGISVEELEQRAMDTFGVELENLSSKDASYFIRNLQQAA